MADKDDEAFNNFDETNGVVQGLDGDDDGSYKGDGDKHPRIFEGLVRDIQDEGTEGLDSDETPYSEEGRP